MTENGILYSIILFIFSETSMRIAIGINIIINSILGFNSIAEYNTPVTAPLAQQRYNGILLYENNKTVNYRQLDFQNRLKQN